MQTELQVSLGSESHFHPENISVQDRDPDVTLSTANRVLTNDPAKRPTRQWAAWTRQEEESFFTALRQVGKNFEKITQRVQSKNKDQVRYYYYRLVRRINKLLGPGLCLDAKDSKDTNTAMLRWWSLLEKYSCKASKLHLKPRRFKIFIEALEHQLLKDRRKNVKKRPCQGDNCPPAAPISVPNHSRLSGQDARMVKLIVMDSQNVKKLGSGKASLKRSISVGVNRTNNKGETAMKPVRQRRKPAAYKKWEKAAIAGVSLVADAAEHLERTTTDKEVENDPGQKVSNPVSKVLPPLPTYPHNLFVENNILISMKLKLQLFPFDDGTRRALEMDKYNPHLELTLSSRKKISSVLEHLNRKWGNSSVVYGELMLFPYSVHGENVMDWPRWTQDSIVSAADVYVMIGRPPVFRLRYGWFSDTELGSAGLLQPPSASCCIPAENIMNSDNIKITDSSPISVPSTIDQTLDLYEDQPASTNQNDALPGRSNYVPREMNKWRSCKAPNNNCVESSDLAANISWCQKEAGDEAGDGTIMRLFEDVDDLTFGTRSALTAGDWADTLTNISIGDQLSGVSHDIDVNCIDPPVAESSRCLQQVTLSCDSFDADIAAHISKHQDKMEGYQPTFPSNAFSIWDAEETRDAFSYKKNSLFCRVDPIFSRVSSPGSFKQTTRTSLEGTDCFLEESPQVKEFVESLAEDTIDETQSCTHILDNSGKDFSTLADIYWPDSLGPLDLDNLSSKYHNSEDLILCDSLGSLNCLIASSLDAFQNCSFFGLDKNNQHQ